MVKLQIIPQCRSTLDGITRPSVLAVCGLCCILVIFAIHRSGLYFPTGVLRTAKFAQHEQYAETPNRDSSKLYRPNLEFDALSCCTGPPCQINETSLRFAVVGDWGGMDAPPQTSKIQRALALRLNAYCYEQQPHFILSPGDNFYWNGVNNVSDNRFKTTFENVYTAPVPWYHTAGNHDWYGNVSAQIEYTRHSKKWVYPNYDYSFEYQLADGVRAKFIFVDAQIMCGKTHEPNILVPTGPEDKSLAADQWRWLENELKAAQSANYLFVVGHYQVYVIGSKDQISCMKEKLGIEFLGQHKVSAYFAGHEHQLQHIEMKASSGTTVHYVISGEGSMLWPKEDAADGLAEENKKYHHYDNGETTLPGFVAVNLTRDSALLTFYDSNNEVLYTFKLLPRQS